MYTSTCVHLVVHERIKRAKMIKQTSIPPLDPNPSSQPPVKSTKQDKLAGPSRYSKHSSTSKTRRVRRSENTSLYCRPFDPPCRHPSERPRIFHISSRKKLGEKSGVTGWIEAKKTTPMKKMFHGDRCKSASTPSLLWRYVRYVWKGRLDHPFPSNHGMAHRVYDTHEAVRVSREDTAFDFRLVIVKEGVR